MAKFSGQLGRWGLFDFWWIFDMVVFGGRDVSHWIGSTFGIQNAWFSAREVEYGSSFDQCSWFVTFQKSGDDSLARHLPCFRPGALESNFRVFWSEPKRFATKSYADSWWYHLEKCLIRSFRVHLRFSIFGHFWRSLPIRLSQSRESSVH